MGTFSSWCIEAYTESGKPIGVSRKESIQDWMNDEGFYGVYGDHSTKDALVMEFSDTSFHIYDLVKNAVEGYARINPDVIIVVRYDFDDYDAHGIMRFHGNDFEEVERVSYYPPFKNIRIPGYDQDGGGK